MYSNLSIFQLPSSSFHRDRVYKPIRDIKQGYDDIEYIVFAQKILSCTYPIPFASVSVDRIAIWERTLSLAFSFTFLARIYRRTETRPQRTESR